MTVDDKTKELVKRLRAPAYWMSGSSEGHEGENDIPLKAADALEALVAERDRLKAALETVRQYVKGGPDHVSDEDITNIFRVADKALEAKP